MAMHKETTAHAAVKYVQAGSGSGLGLQHGCHAETGECNICQLLVTRCWYAAGICLQRQTVMEYLSGSMDVYCEYKINGGSV